MHASGSAPKTLQSRLWFAAVGSAVFLATLVTTNAFVPTARAVRWNMLGYDFRALYIAGSLANSGRSADFYDLNIVGRFDDQIARDNHLDLDQGIGPIFNPPFFAWIFAPLARLPYPVALQIWYALSLLFFGIAVALLLKMFSLASSISQAPECSTLFGASRSACGPCPEVRISREANSDTARKRDRLNDRHHVSIGPTRGNLSPRLLAVLLIGTSLPAIQALIHAQNTFLSLLILVIVVKCWRNKADFAAGLTAGLLFYKPQLGAIIALAVALTMGRRALLGILSTGTALLLINIITLPGTLADFFLKMPANLSWLQTQHAYAWYRHATFRGFFRTLFQGTEPGATVLTVQIASMLAMATIAALLGRVLYLYNRRDGDLQKLDLVISATIVSMPLLMPFYFDYDLLLLCIPAVLTAGGFLRDGRDLQSFADRWLPAAWVIFSIAMIFNVPLAIHTRVALNVPALCILSVLTNLRAARLMKILKNPEPAAVPDDIIVARCAA